MKPHWGWYNTFVVVTIILISMRFYFIEYIWIRLGTYDFPEP